MSTYTLAQGLTAIDTQRKRIAASITQKGVAAADTDTLSALADKVLLIESGSGADNADAIIDRSISGALATGVTKIGNNALQSCLSLTSLVGPNVTTVGDYGVQNCRALTVLDLPNLVSTGEYAFNNNLALTSGSFPELISVNNQVFRACGELVNVHMPKVASIGRYSFAQCFSLLALDFPALTSIMDYALDASGVKTLILRASQVCTLSNINALSSYIRDGAGYVYVPSALVASYKAATNWSAVANQIRAIEDFPGVTG